MKLKIKNWLFALLCSFSIVFGFVGFAYSLACFISWKDLGFNGELIRVMVLSSVGLSFPLKVKMDQYFNE